jgi:hypothetical protein
VESRETGDRGMGRSLDILDPLGHTHLEEHAA